MTYTDQDALPLDLPAAVEPTAPPRVTSVRFREPMPGAIRYTTMDSPLGELLLFGDGEALAGVSTPPKDGSPHRVAERWVADRAPFAEVRRQLAAYFAGELREFDLPLAPAGTPWQLRVWRALTTIPYGETAGYGELAEELGRPTASRALGAANGRNPISVIVPCHRVIGANGSLTGYAGGLERKKKLLNLENKNRV
ncbi:methylated-DNA--[protein]-cysteine S-methyltransferase [Nocardiopsis sp. JB363]|uniref:methylated-DNA--[protein]-cysteine S-methyltransferase n=1 Tax=Nocardiopsis sp. JB363 TaxID=1434837 RepID=UPI00097B3C5E|nr:methylated-DNA--[protein]-cysteine S-methyltransferase [Nocardiopsis sp. JB363]SIO84292.1 Methylated-DNA--protein-cysteine methyltransferase [Nocardiopsis sp. JB363]